MEEPEWMKLDHNGHTHYFRWSTLCRLWAEAQLIITHARIVIDPDEIRAAEEAEKREGPPRKLLTEQDIVDRAAAKGF